MGKLAFVDSLRGFAILLVIINHTAQSIQDLPQWLYSLSYFGKYGVQLFFLMSAYTLSLSWANRTKETNKTGNFYLRRFFRIAPLYYFGILFYGIIVFCKQHYALNTYLLNPDYSVLKVIANFTFTHGLIPDAIHSVVPGGWSIATEMLFYLIFPLIFFMYSKIKSKLWIIVLPCLIAIATFIFFRGLPRIFPPVQSHNFEFYYCCIINQLPVFLLGIGLYLFPSEYIFSRPKALMFLAAFLILLSTVFYLNKKGVNDITLSTFVVGVSFVCLFVAVKNFNFLNTKFMQWVGRLSFSIYVFHFVFAWGISAFISQQLVSHLSSVFVYLIALTVTIFGSSLISFITKYMIEDRGIELGKKIIKNR